MSGEDLRDQSELQRMMLAGTKFKYVVIENGGAGGYRVVFRTEASARFIVCKQKRQDRGSGAREFKTIDAAVKSIRNIGWTQIVVIAADV